MNIEIARVKCKNLRNAVVKICKLYDIEIIKKDYKSYRGKGSSDSRIIYRVWANIITNKFKIGMVLFVYYIDLDRIYICLFDRDEDYLDQIIYSDENESEFISNYFKNLEILTKDEVIIKDIIE